MRAYFVFISSNAINSMLLLICQRPLICLTQIRATLIFIHSTLEAFYIQEQQETVLKKHRASRDDKLFLDCLTIIFIQYQIIMFFLLFLLFSGRSFIPEYFKVT